MAELGNAKTYGGIGALLLLIGGVIPNVGSIISIIGLVLIFLGVRSISDVTNDNEIFKNFLLSFIFNIIAIVSFVVILLIGFGAVGGFSWLATVQTADITDFPAFWNLFGEIIIAGIIGLFIAWVFLLLGAIYLRKSYQRIAKHTHVKYFETTGTLYLIGAITTIILIGFLILFIARIFEIISFFSLPDSLPTNSPKNQDIRRCKNCGRVIPYDANVCPYCGKNFMETESS